MEEKKDENKYAGLTAALATGAWCHIGIARAPKWKSATHSERRGRGKVGDGRKER